MKSVRLDGKVLFPSKIVCIGRNYVEHIRELGNEIPAEPVIFIKPNSAIADGIRAGEPGEIHYEGEICFIIRCGEPAAVGFGLDLTRRELQNKLKAKGLPWERAKAFDGAAVFSEFVSYNGEPDDLRLELYINDRLVQQGGCDLMMYKPAAIVSEVKGFLSFEDGDVVMTGTPAGVGEVRTGDRFEGRIYAGEELLTQASWLAP